eukprot:COSAG01_NODE_35972_length_524_cov_0.832941_1_plen_122_part_10
MAGAAAIEADPEWDALEAAMGAAGLPSDLDRALLLAAAEGRAEDVARLLSAGAAVDGGARRSSDGSTALHLAAGVGDVRPVEALLGEHVPAGQRSCTHPRATGSPLWLVCILCASRWCTLPG